MNQSHFVPKRWRLRFQGRVQRVGFRYTALYTARALHLTGWVSNCSDGTVLLEAQGTILDLRRLLIRLKSQPPIYIERYSLEELPPVQGEKTFSVRREYR